MTMIERVALAIIEERNKLAAEAMAGGSIGLSYDGDTGPRIARAAIEAMLEPTEEMIEAGADEVGPKDSRTETPEGCAEECYRAMLTTALRSDPSDEVGGR